MRGQTGPLIDPSLSHRVSSFFRRRSRWKRNLIKKVKDQVKKYSDYIDRFGWSLASRRGLKKKKKINNNKSRCYGCCCCCYRILWWRGEKKRRTAADGIINLDAHQPSHITQKYFFKKKNIPPG